MLTLNNVAIFATTSELYITRGDQELIRVTGQEKHLLELVISEFNHAHDSDEVYTKLSSNFDNNKSHYDLVVDFLKANNILVDNQDKGRIHKNLAIIGSFKDKASLTEIIETTFSKCQLTVNISSISEPIELDSNTFDVLTNGIDLIVLFAPYFGVIDMGVLNELSTYTYNKNISILHVGLENNSLIFGPLIVPELNTPTLSCYLQRKLSSYDNLSKFLTASNIPNKTVLSTIDLLSNRYFPVLINIICIELEKYYTKNITTGIVAREIEIDINDYSTSNIKILKMPNSLSQGSHFYPFNG